MNKTWQR